MPDRVDHWPGRLCRRGRRRAVELREVHEAGDAGGARAVRAGQWMTSRSMDKSHIGHIALGVRPSHAFGPQEKGTMEHTIVQGEGGIHNALSGRLLRRIRR